MRKFLNSFFFGIGMLILVFLGLKNANAVAAIFLAGSNGVNEATKALQGR